MRQHVPGSRRGRRQKNSPDQGSTGAKKDRGKWRSQTRPPRKVLAAACVSGLTASGRFWASFWAPTFVQPQRAAPNRGWRGVLANYWMSLAVRAAALASWHAAGSVSATPRVTTTRPPMITSQYQRLSRSPFGMMRNSTPGAVLLTAALLTCNLWDVHKTRRSPDSSSASSMRLKAPMTPNVKTKFVLPPLTPALIC